MATHESFPMHKMVLRQACRACTASSICGRPYTLRQRRRWSSAPPEPAPGRPAAVLSPRWLSDIKQRIGKCLMFGMRPEQVDQAGQILKELATDWRSLVAGSEGFLTEPGRVGVQSQAVAWGEQDSMGHVNNVQYVRYAETGRCNWTQNLGAYFDRAHQKEWEDLLSSRKVGLILRSITVDFKFPMTWPDCISVYHKLRSRPTRDMDSMILDVMILSEAQQRPAARCLEDCVVYNYRQGKKSTIPGFMFDQFVKAFDLQEASKERNTRRAMSLLDRVKSLETQTWDRRDAKEDFGTSLR